MTDDEVRRRMDTLLAEEIARGKSSRYYLSFAGPDGFRGGAIVMALGSTHALIETKQRGINPGGQVLVLEIDDAQDVNPAWMNRLLSRDDMERYNMNPRSYSELKDTP